MTCVRIARPEEFEQVAALYDEMVADMAHSAFDPHWNRENHPSDAFLKQAVEHGQLIVCEYEGELAGALVLDSGGAQGYEGARGRPMRRPTRPPSSTCYAPFPACREKGLHEPC